MKKFSNIVECVKSNPAASDYTSAEMFEKQDIEEFLKWKRNLSSDRLPLVPVDSVTMPQSGVKACETALNVVAKQDRKKSKVLDGKWYVDLKCLAFITNNTNKNTGTAPLIYFPLWSIRGWNP